MKLVTSEQAARHLRLDDLDDAEIAQDLADKILQVSDLVIDFLKYPAIPDGWLDSAGEPLFVPPKVQTAALIWLGILWKHRDGESDDKQELGEVPRVVSSLLYRIREPSYA